jgi:SpoVK/Ycf46/Vps4 family AAA+-type ATPase
MHAAALHVLRTAHRPISRRACRIIGGSRHPLAHRNFHRSAISYRIPEDPTPTETKNEAAASENTQDEPNKADPEIEGGESKKPNVEIEDLALTPRVKNGKAGTGRITRGRPRQPEGLPPFVLPEWFLEKNVKCVGDPDLSGTLAVFGEGGVNGEQDGDSTTMDAEIARQSVDISECDLTPTESAKYSMHVDIYREILSALRAALALRPPKNSTLPVPRPVTVLQCPRDGGTYYLDSIVETIATKLGADLIRLDAQDMAQIIGPVVEENMAWAYSKTSVLAFEAHRVAGKLEEYEKETSAEDGEEEEEEDILGGIGKRFPFINFKKTPKNELKAPPGFKLNSFLSKLPGVHGATGFVVDIPNPQGQTPTKGPTDQWNDLKISSVLETLCDASDAKRASIDESEDSPSTNISDGSRDIIVQIKDYKELSGTEDGADLLSRFRSVINKKWQSGRNIICVGTTSAEDTDPVLSRPEIQHLQSDIIDGEKRTIFVPPDRREEQDIAFETDEKARIRRINVRHIEDMILKLVDGTDHLTAAVDIEKDIDSATVYSAGLEDAVWTYARVHRVATTILGMESSPSSIDGTIFSKALKILAASDEAKFSWGAEEIKQEEAEMEITLDEHVSAQKKAKDKLKEVRKKCNPHEKKLLSGVVLPADIRTTFADIRAPKETVEALKTLTSLSLIRPEAFSYGVLATDKIPGLLLYGPPGTGKTLLAKAVAKESGATVLEVSAADLNDMFVGEGEKNVKALFTLAKKLSPCVVFIDEADAVLSARGEGKRVAHRELINQFLREWDGMNDLSAFIMVATNRPFDLDEAVLRRLPRRLLIDLPTEKDREAILKIHLKEEILDESVSLSKIAKDTPFYSGSDLKNLSVAAALACIREENDIAAKHTGEEPHVYPEKRILTKAHFDRAMEEISASISEDMSTLTAIRKFDEKYGDRKGRRKKNAALGFGGTTVVERDSEAARVRKMEA